MLHVYLNIASELLYTNTLSVYLYTTDADHLHI